MGIIEFPIFTGDDLRQWISWLEDFFVQENFTALEKLNLAQSLLEGEAETWFYRSQKRFSFQSWEHLQDLLIWRFGDFSDPALFLLWDKNDRLLQKQRADAKIRRMKPTLIPEKDSIQVPVSSLEPSLRFSNESLVVSEARLSAIVSTNRVHSQFGFECVKNKNNAHHVFDELLLRRHKFQQRKKPSLSPKSRMFKFKNRTLLSNWSQMDLHQVIDISNVTNLYPCFSANFGLVRKTSKFQCLRLQTQAHKSRVLYQLRMLHDPGGMKQLLHGDMKSWFVCERESGKRFRDMAVQPKHQVGLDKIELQLDQRDITLVGLQVEIARLLCNLQGPLVSGLVEFNLGYFRCHKEYGLARMVNWSQVRVECSLLQGKLFCQNSLSRNMPSIPVIVAQFKFKQGLETRIGLTVETACLLDVICVWAECMMHKTTVISAKLPETIRGIELVTDSGQLKAVLEQIIQRKNEAYTKIIDKLQIKLKQGMDIHGASWHCSTYEMNQFHSPIGLVDDTLVDALHSGLGENVHTLLAAEVHEYVPGQLKFSSIWHRWRRKD